MARQVLCVLVLCAVAGLARFDAVAEDETDLYSQKIKELFNFVSEPLPPEIQNDIKSYGSIKDHLDKFENATAANTYHVMLEEGWFLPRGQPFSIDEPAHAFEVFTLFNALSSTKDFKTLYQTAAYLRNKINEGIFVNSLIVSTIYNKNSSRPKNFDPPIFEILPNYFHNAEIMSIIKKISVYGTQTTQIHPNTYLLGDDKIVINASSTYWPYVNDNSFALSYFTNDIGVNAALCFSATLLPSWLRNDQLGRYAEDLGSNRGFLSWFTSRQIIARYYMERLSNGLGEIPEITNVIEDGFNPGLLHLNGVPFPSRPDNYRLDQPHLTEILEKALEFETRIWEAIDQGFYIDRQGEKVTLLSEESLNILGNLIESNVDSPNRHYYKDFIRLWKQILGNTVKSNYKYKNSFTPLTVPSALEKYETALRDPAFYMLYKRVLKLFVHWQKQMPLYKPEELASPGIKIQNIETDELVTYFEPVLINATQALYRKPEEKNIKDKTPEVFVKYECLTHKPFSVRIKVRSEKNVTVIAKLFLAPKYDSKGLEIPLHQNTENFYMVDYFPHLLAAGENVITRKFTGGNDTAIEGTRVQKGVFNTPQRVFLPKGNVGGQVFQLIAYIQDYDSMLTAKRNLAFPSDRPLHSYQLLNVKNIKFEDVKVYNEE